jgi:hypothetical protein
VSCRRAWDESAAVSRSGAHTSTASAERPALLCPARPDDAVVGEATATTLDPKLFTVGDTWRVLG